jgi:hypothetical protein
MTANMYRVGGKEELYNIITEVLNSRAGYSIRCCVRIDILFVNEEELLARAFQLFLLFQTSDCCTETNYQPLKLLRWCLVMSRFTVLRNYFTIRYGNTAW